jgi:hypothetical protein
LTQRSILIARHLGANQAACRVQELDFDRDAGALVEREGEGGAELDFVVGALAAGSLRPAGRREDSVGHREVGQIFVPLIAA